MPAGPALPPYSSSGLFLNNWVYCFTKENLKSFRNPWKAVNFKVCLGFTFKHCAIMARFGALYFVLSLLKCTHLLWAVTAEGGSQWPRLLAPSTNFLFFWTCRWGCCFHSSVPRPLSRSGKWGVQGLAPWCRHVSQRNQTICWTLGLFIMLLGTSKRASRTRGVLEWVWRLCAAPTSCLCEPDWVHWSNH